MSGRTAGLRAMIVVVALGCRADEGDPESGTPETGAPVDTETSGDTETATVPELEPGVWSYAPIDGMTCGNGEATGIGVNPGSDPTRVVFLVDGVGSCWDFDTCFTARTAPHLESGWGRADLAAETAPLASSPFFDRTDPANPWGDASWVLIPYCTGDLHVGRTVQHYDPGDASREVHHAGDANFAAALAFAGARFPAATKLWAVGVSGGGYGVQLQADRFGATWPGADLAILADSAPLAKPSTARQDAFDAAWDPRLPPGAPPFASFSNILAAQVLNVPDARFALLQAEDDGAVTTFLDVIDLKPALDSLLLNSYEDHDKLQAFVVSGASHVQLQRPNQVGPTGVALLDWVAQWRDDDPAWADAY